MTDLQHTNASRALLIFSGSNERAIVAFCRVLHSLGIAPLIVARTDQDAILRTRYRQHVVATRRMDQLDLDDITRCLQEAQARRQGARLVLCPTSEFLNLFLLQHRHYLRQLGCEIPLVDGELYRLVSDKYSFSRLCATEGAAIPQELADYRGQAFPFVAKPRQNVNRANRSLYPYLIHSAADLDAFLISEQTADFYFEEYLSGESYYLLYYLGQDGRVTRFSQQNLLQQAGGKSIVLARPAQLHRQPVADQYVGILRRLGFWGLAMIEVIRRGDDLVFIELNPRFWGPMQLTVDARAGILEAFVADQLGGDLPLHRHTGSSHSAYLWLNGWLANTRRGQQPRWHITPATHAARFVLRHLAHDIYLRRDTLGLFVHEFSQALRPPSKPSTSTDRTP